MSEQSISPLLGGLSSCCLSGKHLTMHQQITTEPARLHQAGQTVKEAHVSLQSQIIQHFLERIQHERSCYIKVGFAVKCQNFGVLCYRSNISVIQPDLFKPTCWTDVFPPFRIAMPSFNVAATIGPISPGSNITSNLTA